MASISVIIVFAAVCLVIAAILAALSIEMCRNFFPDE